MTFNTNVPDASQSPGLFPPQNATNFTRLKALIQGDHKFNSTLAANDGRHKQVTLINRADPGSVPAGTNSMLYGKAATDAVNELWFYDNVGAYQLNWRQRNGTVNLPDDNFYNVVAVPTNCYGEIYLFKEIAGEGPHIQAGTFVSNGSIVNGFSYAEKWQSSSGASQMLRLGFQGDGGSGLTIRIRNNSGFGTFNGVWTYRVFYRKYA